LLRKKLEGYGYLPYDIVLALGYRWRTFMRVSKWGNSLAVRLPKELVEAMELKSGDELEIVAAGDRRCEVSKRDRRKEFLEALKQFRFELPPDYQFDRDEANAR